MEDRRTAQPPLRGCGFYVQERNTFLAVRDPSASPSRPRRRCQTAPPPGGGNGELDAQEGPPVPSTSRAARVQQAMVFDGQTWLRVALQGARSASPSASAASTGEAWLRVPLREAAAGTASGTPALAGSSSTSPSATSTGEVEADPGAGGEDAATAPALLPQPQTLFTAKADNGASWVHWVVDARKLQGNNQQVVSPPFELALSKCIATPFKMMLFPKRLDSVRRGACFKSVRGKGIVKLKCEGDVPEAGADMSVRFSIGSTAQGAMQSPRGPLAHDFAKCAMCGLPKDQEDWEFNSVIDEDSMTFVVHLEVETAALSSPAWGATER